MGRIIPYIVENKKMFEITNQIISHITIPKLVHVHPTNCTGFMAESHNQWLHPTFQCGNPPFLPSLG
jgi:hypothetical protein